VLNLKKIIESKKFYWSVAVFFIVLAVIAVTALPAYQPKKQQTLSQEDLAKLVKPAVVRIIQHATGQAIIPNFELDLKNLSIKLLPNQPSKPQVVDEYISGSGFIVNSEGYILTNAHVVSLEVVKELLLERALQQSLETTAGSNQGELKTLLENEQSLLIFAENAFNLLRTNSDFVLKGQITVLNPSEPQEHLFSLLQTGFSAEIISVNENFLADDKDLGLIKINAANLPTLELGNSEQVSVGNKIYIFGFPSTAEFNRKSPLESTLTQGVVSAIKYSQNKDFKIFQTDAKISQGSSGGPLFNENGQAVGLITFQTAQLQKFEGDNFAFAIPIYLAKGVIEKKQIPNTASSYSLHFQRGLSLFYDRGCKKAIGEFKNASLTNLDFVGNKHLENYVKQCNELIAQGKSVDNAFKAAVVFIKSIKGFTWFIILGRLILIGLGFWVFFWIIKRVKKDETEINFLQAQLQEELERKNKLLFQLEQKGVELPLPNQELHAASRRQLNIPHPHLIDFIKEAREIGLSDENIKQELKNCGWPEEEILQALNL